MSEAAHDYDINVSNEEVARLLALKRKPWWNPTVLRHLHHELNMSLSEIGDVFGIKRQSVHEAAQKIGVLTERKQGSSKAVDEDQTRLSEYGTVGFADFI